MTTSLPGRPDDSPTITARTPDDILAAVPILIGFTPEESIVMLTLGPQPCFHARIDLPTGPEDWAEVFELLLTPALTHGVSRVAFVVYAAQAQGLRSLADALVWHFEEHSIRVVDALHADGRLWFPLLPGFVGAGVPYDPEAHPITAQAVFDGLVTFGSRADLAASIDPLPDQIAHVVSALADLPPRERDEADWIESVLPTRGELVLLDASGLARLLRAVADLELRDLAWLRMRRRDAEQHVEFWTWVVRQAPAELVPAPAALLAFAAWLAGRGALAWCALERCTEIDPGYSFAGVLTRLLEEAVPPHVWESFVQHSEGQGPA
jgi:hypothetical protein